MALQYKRNGLLRVKKLAGAFIAIAAFLVQPLAVVPINTVFATPTDTLYENAGPVNVDKNTSYTSSSIDGSAHNNLQLSFGYDMTSLDAGDVFTYGWQEGATQHVLATVNGVNGDSPAVQPVEVALPAEAAVGNLQVYATVSANVDADIVNLTNIKVAGEAVEQNAVCASGCEYTTIADAVVGESAGSTITVKNGSYTAADININKSLTINGESLNAVVTVTGTNGFDVWADDVTIHGLTIVGPADGVAYTSYAWGNTVTRGIAVHNGIDNFAITDNVIRGLRNNILVDGRNTGVITENTIDNSKSGISVQYSDAGTGNTEGYAIDISGNQEGVFGNEWGLNTHLNGHYVGGSYHPNVPNSDSEKIAVNAPSIVQTALKQNSAANDGWTVQDQGYRYHNRTAVRVGGAGAADTNQGSIPGPLATIQAGVNAIVSGGALAIAGGAYTENVTLSNPIALTGAGVTLVGQFSVYSSDVSISGFTVTNPSYSGPTIRGVHVYGDNSGIHNVTVNNNVFTNIRNNNTKGAYAVMVQGNVTGVEVSENTINGISSAGWAHGIEVTPGGGVTAVPTNVTVTKNTIGGVSNDSHLDQYDFSLDSSGSLSADASEVSFVYNRLSGAVRNLDTVNALNASANWWGQDTGPTADRYTGNVTVAPWCAQAACTSLFSDEAVQLEATGGVATTDSSTPLALSGTTSDGTVSVVIPESTTVTSSDLGWDGTIAPPTVSAYEAPGGNKITSLAVTVGSDSSRLSFDKGVRLVLPGQAGKRIGFLSSTPGSVFTEITTVCSVDDSSQPVSPAGECKIDVGSDLVIWTKHFTTFVTFTVDTTKPAGSFTAPITGSTRKGLVNISANVSDSETGLNNLQVVLRNSSNVVVGNWSYNVQTGTANTIAGTGTISFSGTPASGTVTVQNVNTASFATGQYNLRLFTSDVAGNGNSAIYGNFYVDNSAPDGNIAPFSVEQRGDTTVTVDISEVGTAGLGQQQLVMRDGSGNVAGNWTYNVATGVSNTIAGPNASFIYTGDETSGQLKLTFDSSTLANGTYSLRLFTKDQLGTGRSNIYGSVTFDNTVPSVSFDSPAPGSTVRDLTIDATMNGTGSNMKQYGFDVSGPGGLHFSTRNYQVDQPTVTVSDFDLCAAQYYGDDCPVSLPNGSYTIRAKAYDKAGNRNITTTLALTVDTTAPVVGAGDDQTVTGLSAMLSGTSDDAATYEWTKVSGPGDVTFTDASAATTNVSVGAYGSYVFQLKGTDGFDNSNVDVVTVVFTQPVVIPTNDGTLSPVSPLGSTSNGQTGSSVSNVAPNFGAAPDETTTTDDNGKVLGTSTTDTKDKSAVVKTSSEGWQILGLAWYWWLVIMAGIGAAWWALNAWRNRGADSF